MTLSLIRGKHVVCKVTGPHSAEVISDGAVLQRDGVIEAVGDYRELSRQHPDAVLRLHTLQHLADECVFANGENPHLLRDENGRPATYDGVGDFPLNTARCHDFNETRAVILDCAEKAIDAINARHDWNATFQRNE